MTQHNTIAKHLLLTIAFVVALASIASPTAQAGKSDKRLDIYWIDVEGGAATLIVTPAGESILIDTGNPGARDATRIFKVATEVARLREINHLIVTHYHRDHFGGAATLAGALPIRHVHDNGIFETIRERPSKEYLQFEADKRSVINPGDVIKLKNVDDKNVARVTLRCLTTRQKFPAAGDAPKNAEACASAPSRPEDMSDNANSVVTLIGFGRFRFFDGGDLTWNLEKKLVCPVNRVGKVDVYQVTHHGLGSSNNPVIVKTLAPTVAVMNNGVTKGCNPAVFATLKGTKSIQAIYQMHKNLRKDRENNVPDEYIANIERECKANYIKLSVDPTGKTYTITIPANGHKRTYKTKL